MTTFSHLEKKLTFQIVDVKKKSEFIFGFFQIRTITENRGSQTSYHLILILCDVINKIEDIFKIYWRFEGHLFSPAER